MPVLGTSYITEKVLPKIKNKFWTDVFLSHVQVSTRNTPTEIQQFQTNPIFFNENIKIGNKTLYNKSCIENGIELNTSMISQKKMVTFIHMTN